MRARPVVRWAAVIVALAVWPSASALGTEITGSLTSPSGLFTEKGWADTLSWDISSTSDGRWHYSYTISNHDNDTIYPEVPRVIFESSPGLTFELDSGTRSEGVQLWSEGDANPRLPGDLYGIRLYRDSGTPGTCYTVGFTVDQEPHWGDFYGNYHDEEGCHAVWNTGFGHDCDCWWCCHPVCPGGNGPTVIPEPSLSVLALTALLAGAVARRRKKETEV